MDIGALALPLVLILLWVGVLLTGFLLWLAVTADYLFKTNGRLERPLLIITLVVFCVTFLGFWFAFKRWPMDPLLVTTAVLSAIGLCVLYWLLQEEILIPEKGRVGYETRKR